ncbi:MAG: hypothetical protein J6031_01195 [Bacteroidales bacterium]|nr:hypothetical protein [Bacteroidales bacterium]
MKSLIIKVMMCTVLLVVVACGKREGVIVKKYKIDEVMAFEKHYYNDALFHSVDSYVEEDWHWDGKEMYRIDYRSDHPYSENFFYGSHGRLERTTVPAYGISSEFHYDGRMLEHIDFYQDEKPLMTVSVVHGEKKIEEIDCQYYNLDTNAVVKCCNPLASLLGNEVASNLEKENAQRRLEQHKRGVKSLNMRYVLSWSDDNVTAIKCIDADGTRNIAISYDDKNNPYNQLYGYRELSDPLFGFEMLSENNILTIRMPYQRNKNQLFTYRYEYDGKCPTRRTLTYSYPTISVTTLDSVMFRYEKVETFVYVD